MPSPKTIEALAKLKHNKQRRVRDAQKEYLKYQQLQAKAFNRYLKLTEEYLFKYPIQN